MSMISVGYLVFFFFFSSRRRHTRFDCDWSSDVCSSDLYETLLNTDLAREEAQLARFLSMVAEHKHRIGFKGTLLIEPKPQEPTKHQYDYDAATVMGFLQRHGLANEYRLNLEANHAILAGHSFHH